MAMNSAPTISSPASTNIFNLGKYPTKFINIESKSCSLSHKVSPFSPAKPLLVCSPTEAGEFPVLVILHGYLLYNNFYSQLIQHIASHGFIVVAPQLYCVAGPDTHEEIEATAKIINWLSEGLIHFLPPDVDPNLKKLGLAGHSRGGKVAFALALRKSSLTTLDISAIIGIDPVDGMDKGKQTPPPILTYTPRSFDFGGSAALVIGSGLGEVKKNPLFPPCAPRGVNHENFYDECSKPAYYFVVKDQGHLDMLDDDTRGVRGKATFCLCKNGKCREPMRLFVGGAVVAFLKGYVEGDTSELVELREGRLVLPVELQRVEYLV
ncbi:Chlorophyllase-2, chloroplast precursor [Dorcoceras hygrometricum]|uniref:chlorophyllase n=1 Tax=Dorcoceras hygrometricum TaxID=472368 RepID=A0A2Z7AYC3_9LAMI|nr:Chlorophyllase-2, chloroplast precursor [Dorcoceras hygrometricum]